VQRIVELALEAPFELGMVEVAGMKIEVIDVHGNGGVFELDYDLDAFGFGAGGERQQRMFVELELGLDAIEAWVRGFRHARILAEGRTEITTVLASARAGRLFGKLKAGSRDSRRDAGATSCGAKEAWKELLFEPLVVAA
jgi:hypothetical protein